MVVIASPIVTIIGAFGLALEPFKSKDIILPLFGLALGSWGHVIGKLSRYSVHSADKVQRLYWSNLYCDRR